MIKTFDHRAALAIAALATTLLSTQPALSDDSTTTTKSDEACAAFTPTQLPHGAKVAKTEYRQAHAVFPEACIVRGTIVSSAASTINWAVELPPRDRWNGKSLTYGGSGFDGFIPTDTDYYHGMAGPSSRAFVRMSSDAGHQIRGFFPWGLDDTALKNHGFEANHLTLEIGVRIATQFYGREPTRRYMFGQSNGGRAGLVAAQRYPTDYHGIVALEPAIAQQAHQVNLGATTMKHIYSSRENWLSKEKVALFAEAEIKACDKLDGLEDGVIGNVAACNYIPTDLLCKGADNDRCLTAGQIESIRLIYTDHKVPVTFADGATGYPRFGRGGAATSDWAVYVFGNSFESREAFNYMAATEAAKVVEGKQQLDTFKHDPAKFSSQYLRLSKQIDVTNPDISAFANNGGKLLIWYGTADTCVTMYKTADYFAAMKKQMGTEKVASFARFLTSPGVGHNLDGPGAGTADFVAAMDRWVENGVAPDQLVAAKLSDDFSKRLFERPVCEFPKFPRYKGTGDTSKAESFTCSES
jgi:feruloyl esterase